jgi:hypothetical protein
MIHIYLIIVKTDSYAVSAFTYPDEYFYYSIKKYNSLCNYYDDVC